MFVIISAGNRQFKVQPGDSIRAPLMKGEKPKTKVQLDVLAIGEDSGLLIGNTDLKKASVTATVLRHGLGKKLLVFKKKRRKGYRKTRGFREAFTELQIGEIKLPSGKILSEKKKTSSDKAAKTSQAKTSKTSVAKAAQEQTAKKTEAVKVSQEKAVKKSAAVKVSPKTAKTSTPTDSPQKTKKPSSKSDSVKAEKKAASKSSKKPEKKATKEVSKTKEKKPR